MANRNISGFWTTWFAHITCGVHRARNVDIRSRQAYSSQALAISCLGSSAKKVRRIRWVRGKKSEWQLRSSGTTLSRSQHHHGRTDLHPAVEVDHILIGQPDAAGGNRSP